MGLDQPFYGLQSQRITGSQNTIEEMAASYIKEIRTIQPDGPYFLGGASFGGVVAFEVARQLSVQGIEVGLLVLFDTYAPDYYFDMPGYWQRIKYHILNLVRGPEKLSYIKKKSKTLRKRIDLARF